MQVAPGSSDRDMTQRRLKEVDRRAAVEGVARVGVAQPVCRDRGREPGPGRHRLHDPVHGVGVERAALARAEHRIVRPGRLASGEIAPAQATVEDCLAIVSSRGSCYPWHLRNRGNPCGGSGHGSKPLLRLRLNDGSMWWVDPGLVECGNNGSCPDGADTIRTAGTARLAAGVLRAGRPRQLERHPPGRFHARMRRRREAQPAASGEAGRAALKPYICSLMADPSVASRALTRPRFGTGSKPEAQQGR